MQEPLLSPRDAAPSRISPYVDPVWGPTPSKTLHAPPPDRWNCAYCIFFLLGAGTVLPWNAIISAVDFWMRIFDKALKPIYWFEACEMFPIFGFTLLLALYGERMSLHAKLLGGNVLGGLLLLGACFLAQYAPDTAPDTSTSASSASRVLFYVSCVGVFLTGMCAAMTIAGLFGLAAQFPKRYTQAVLGGQALAGVVLNALRIATKLCIKLPEDPTAPEVHTPSPPNARARTYINVRRYTNARVRARADAALLRRQHAQVCGCACIREHTPTQAFAEAPFKCVPRLSDLRRVEIELSDLLQRLYVDDAPVRMRLRRTPAPRVCQVSTGK